MGNFHTFHRRGPRFAGLALLGASVSTALALATYRMHFNQSTASSLQLLLIVLVTLRFGFKQATVVSVMAVLNLDYLFTAPVFKITVDQPEDWVALITFEATALVVSALSNKVWMHATQAELERSRSAKLYELSRAILLLDNQEAIGPQLRTLIRDLFQVREVELWDIYDSAADTGTARDVFVAGEDMDDPEMGVSYRMLSLGTRPIGAMVLRGWEANEAMVNGIASLAAVALERAHSLDKQNRAEAGRQTELLRTTVLDGLAHAIKTPLTGIMMASSGMLAVGALTPVQEELMSVINAEAVTLNQLTTNLLRTAALEAREVRLQRSTFAVAGVIEEILCKESEALRARVEVTLPAKGSDVHADLQLTRLALAQLIDNAAKYSPVDSPIGITVREQGSEMCVVVRNAGSTIRMEERERIFERYYRGADSARGPAGTGLGLSIVKKAAEAHQGSAWVECGDDTIQFFLTLPHNTGRRHG